MAIPDLNLLITLDVLLAESSVVAAARRLQLSPSAMSRALARLRDTMGDPLLVRAGRGLVPTPRALELRDQVSQLVDGAKAVLRPAQGIDVKQLTRTFTLRTSEGFVENFGADLLARVGCEAPGVRLRFAPKPDKDSRSLRDGEVDLETGVISETMGPELRAQGLFRDRFVGVVKHGHPLSAGAITAERYAVGEHILVSRRGLVHGPVDSALVKLGLRRDIATIVGGFSDALALVGRTDMIASVPERHSASLRAGLFTFALPIVLPDLMISLIWHPRLDADPAHRWLRQCVATVCGPQ